MNIHAVQSALYWLKAKHIAVPLRVQVKAILSGAAHSRAVKAAEYQLIRDRFWSAVYEAVQLYLSLGGRVTEFKSQMKQAVVEAWHETESVAYVDGGGSLPVDDETQEYTTAEQNAQVGYVDSLFVNLRNLRNEGDYDDIAEAFATAERWCNSLDLFYNNIKTAAAGNKMLTFDGDDGKESCSDCQKYKGKRHRASWWVSHNAVPPNRDFECHGYHCEHRLYDDQGNEWTV